MKHTIAFSDTHIHNNDKVDHINHLCKYVEDRRPELLVLIGDIADPWQEKWKEIRRTQNWDRLCQLCAARDAAGLKTVYIRGNHDNGVKKEHLRGKPHQRAKTKPLKRLTIKWRHREGAFLFIHGWQWDPIWGRLPGQILFWISRNLPCLMIPLNNCLSRLKGSTPGNLKAKGSADEWNKKTKHIHDMARRYARKHELTVVLGHTHYPWVNNFIADAGDWEDSFSLVEISADGTVTLRHLVDSVRGIWEEMPREDGTYTESQSMWPKKKTAFLVIHGAGRHRPFQAVDSFARGFRQALRIWNPQLERTVDWQHKLQSHKGRESPWIESSISLALNEDQVLDFYEYYWDCYMVRTVTMKDILEWLDTTSAGAREFYKHLPQKAEDYENMGVDVFGDGEFNRRGYRVILGAFSPILKHRVLMGDIMHCLLGRGWLPETIKNKIIDMVGDVVIYTQSDVRSANYDIRKKMLDGAVEELKLLLANDRYQQIVVVGHSLGSIIAYDALERVVLEMNVAGSPLYEQPQKIMGLVTFGSPLDKIAFFFEQRTHDENFVQRQILSQLHGFRRIGPFLEREPRIVDNPIKKDFEKLTWLNYYHLKDPVSGSLDAYDVHQNIQCMAKAKNSSQAHSCYWKWSQMYRDIANHFFQ